MTYGADEHAETHNSEKGHHHIAVPTQLSAVGYEADCDGHDGCDGVWRDGEQLCVSGFVAEVLDDGWDEEGEGVECTIASHVDDHAGVGLPVLERCPKVCHFEFFVLG